MDDQGLLYHCLKYIRLYQSQLYANCNTKQYSQKTKVIHIIIMTQILSVIIAKNCFYSMKIEFLLIIS